MITPRTYSSGDLLTEFPSAGMADFTSPNSGGFWGHQKNDVAPFNLASRIDSYIGDGSNEYVEKYYEVRPSK